MEFFKSKTGRILLLVAALLSASVPVAVKMYNPSVNPNVTPVVAAGIFGPEQAAVGQLVRLKATGDDVQWKAVPATEDFQAYGDDNENVNVSFRAPGKYMFIAASIEDGKPTLSIIEIVVGNSPTAPPITPPSVVVPTPGVVPAVPTTNPVLATQVTQWAVTANAPKAEVGKLAANFGTVANEIQAGRLKTPGEVLKRTQELNSSLDLNALSAVNGQIAAYFTAQADSGQLVTVEQHRTVWASIAEGLAKYANN